MLISAIGVIVSALALVVSALALGYTIYSQKNEATSLAAGRIRNDLVRFASDSELLIERVYTKGPENLSMTHRAYTSILREIEGVSIRPTTDRDLPKFILPGIYRSDWYRSQQSIGDSIRSVAAHFHGRLRVLSHVASLQIRIIEYPMSIEGMASLLEIETEDMATLLKIDSDQSLLEACAEAKPTPEVASDLMKCSDYYVKIMIGAMELLRTSDFTDFPEVERFEQLREFGGSLGAIFCNLNNFVQEYATGLVKLSDKALVELSRIEADASLGQLGADVNLPEHIQLVAKEIQTYRAVLESSCCDDGKDCCNFAQNLKNPW